MTLQNLQILIADDHSIVREGVVKSLSSISSDIIFKEAGSTAEVLRTIANDQFNLIILDINMPGRNGMEVLKEIRETNPEVPVIIFSMYPEDQFAVRAIKAGAAAYLTKDTPAAELCNAVRKILNGERYMTPSIADLITSEIRDLRSREAHEILSDREYEVFLLIASGKSVSDIARELSLSVKTISVYRSNILGKMNLKNNAEIIHYAFKKNLVD